ncbi:DUF3653 domain-containing protein [Vibrio apostichopi]|uniref:DUF3653 domain-containing protein n=1 Tax=Vibrio apostichopi TaxID=3035453 RepID=UPI003EB6D389
MITPERREFNPKELLNFAYWRDEHRQLVERRRNLGCQQSLNKQPSHAITLLALQDSRYRLAYSIE